MNRSVLTVSVATMALVPIAAACSSPAPNQTTSPSPAASPATASQTPSAGATVIAVKATDDACEVGSSKTGTTPSGGAVPQSPPGAVTFQVTNAGSQINEFYVFRQDGKTIVGEVEDIGPGLTRDLTVDLISGSYVTACKPGMTGEGIRGKFEVSKNR